MKKIIAILISVLMLFCVACGESGGFAEGTTCEKILNAATDVKPYDNTELYVKDTTNLDSYTMAMWADGVFQECEEFDLLSDYAICYSKDNTTYEISVLKAKSTNDAKALESLLERRKQTLEGGTKAAYDPNFKQLMQKSKIVTEGEFVILLITDDNDAVISAIEKLK